MTVSELFITGLAVALGVGSISWVRWDSRRLDRELEREREDRRRTRAAE